MIKTIVKQFEVEGIILYKKQKEDQVIIVLEGQVSNIIKLAYDHPLAGYMRQENTYFQLMNNHW